MNQEIAIKRAELKSISQGFKILIKEGAIGSINEGLANYYREQGHIDLKSFKQWKENGFQVKKGSKALLLWGQPKSINKNNEAEEEDEQFFPLAFVFSNLQVEPSAYLSK